MNTDATEIIRMKLFVLMRGFFQSPSFPDIVTTDNWNKASGVYYTVPYQRGGPASPQTLLYIKFSDKTARIGRVGSD